MRKSPGLLSCPCLFAFMNLFLSFSPFCCCASNQGSCTHQRVQKKKLAFFVGAHTWPSGASHTQLWAPLTRFPHILFGIIAFWGHSAVAFAHISIVELSLQWGAHWGLPSCLGGWHCSQTAWKQLSWDSPWDNWRHCSRDGGRQYKEGCHPSMIRGHSQAWLWTIPPPSQRSPPPW